MQIVQENLQPLLDALSAHPYLALFVGLLVAGEIVLLPAIYVATTGRIDILAVATVAVSATAISDCIWYGLGRRFPVSTLNRMSGRLSQNFLNGVDKAFAAGGKRLLFMSKFVYGTRTLMQVLAGVHQMPLRSYLLVNTAGVMAVTGLLILLAYTVVGTTDRLQEVVQHMEIAFLIFVVVAISGFLLVSRRMKQRWSV